MPAEELGDEWFCWNSRHVNGTDERRAKLPYTVLFKGLNAPWKEKALCTQLF
jgi:hypothetical protein